MHTRLQEHNLRTNEENKCNIDQSGLAIERNSTPKTPLQSPSSHKPRSNSYHNIITSATLSDALCSMIRATKQENIAHFDISLTMIRKRRPYLSPKILLSTLLKHFIIHNRRQVQKTAMHPSPQEASANTLNFRPNKLNDRTQKKTSLFFPASFILERYENI